MTDPDPKLELVYMGQSISSPDGAYQLYRSDDMIGEGGRILVSRLGSDAQVEVPYSQLSPTSPRDILWEGTPIARARRQRDGRIVGEWLRPAAPAAAPAPPRGSPGEQPPAAPTSPNEILRAFFELFGWTYEVQLTADQQRDIKDQIRSGWTNADETERELVEYVVKLHQMLAAVPEPARGPLRAMLVETFRAELARPSATDRSRVLAAVHQAVEALRPGATGVTPPEPPGADDWLQLRPAAVPTTGMPSRSGAPRAAPVAAEPASADDLEQDGELDLEAVQRREMRMARLEILRSNIARVQADVAKTMASWK